MTQAGLDLPSLQIDWAKFQLLPRKTRKSFSDELAACIAAAPLEIHAAVLIALEKQSQAKRKAGKATKTARPVAPPVVSAAHQAVIDLYRRDNFAVNVEEKVALFRQRFDRPPRDDWQETRKALLIAACDDLDSLEGLPNPVARQLIAEKYRGLPLGIATTTGKNVSLRMSGTTLWKVHKVGAHLPGGSPDELEMHLNFCGRRSQS